MTTNPVAAEAAGEPVEITFDGETYLVPVPNAWDLDVLEAYEDQKIVAVTKALLGPDGWARFRAKPRKVSDLGDLFDALQSGLGLGN